MKHLRIDCDENDSVDIIILNADGTGGLDVKNLSASELSDALYLYWSTKKELEEDVEQVLLPEEQGKVRALFYTSIEGGKWKRLKHPIYKEGFKSDSFVTIPHAEYSHVAGHEIQVEVMLVGEMIPVFGLVFSDGSIYYHGKRKDFAEHTLTQEDLLTMSTW